MSRSIILGIIASATHMRSAGAGDLFTAAFGPCLSQKLQKKKKIKNLINFHNVRYFDVFIVNCVKNNFAKQIVA